MQYTDICEYKKKYVTWQGLKSTEISAKIVTNALDFVGLGQ